MTLFGRMIIFSAGVFFAYCTLETADTTFRYFAKFTPWDIPEVPAEAEIVQLLLLAASCVLDCALIVRTLVQLVVHRRVQHADGNLVVSLLALVAIAFAYGAYTDVFDLYGPISIEWLDNPLVYSLPLGIFISFFLIFPRASHKLETG